MKPRVRRFTGHPWYGESTPDNRAWHCIEIRTNSGAELDAIVEAFKALHWKVWIQGNDGDYTFGAVLYQPVGAESLWKDYIDEDSTA